MICECGEDGCSATVELTLGEYDDSHSQRDRFVVAPGHEDERIEHVVERTTGISWWTSSATPSASPRQKRSGAVSSSRTDVP